MCSPPPIECSVMHINGGRRGHHLKARTQCNSGHTIIRWRWRQYGETADMITFIVAVLSISIPLDRRRLVLLSTPPFGSRIDGSCRIVGNSCCGPVIHSFAFFLFFFVLLFQLSDCGSLLSGGALPSRMSEKKTMAVR